MKSKLNLTWLLLLVLLISQVVDGENDKKAEIEAKLIEVFQTEGLNLFETIANNTKSLSEELLRGGKPNVQQTKRLEEHIMELEKLNKNKTQMNRQERFEIMAEYFRKKRNEYLHQNTPQDIFYGVGDEIIIGAIRERAQKSEDAAYSFAMKIVYAWTDLYKTLSEEDLENHAEYKRINELMKRIEQTKGKSSSFIEVLQIFIEFFDYKDWDLVLEIGNKQIRQRS